MSSTKSASKQGPDEATTMMSPPGSGQKRTGWPPESDTPRLRRHVSEVTRVLSFHADGGSSPNQRRSLLATQDSRRDIIRRGSVQEIARSEFDASELVTGPDNSRSCCVQ